MTPQQQEEEVELALENLSNVLEKIRQQEIIDPQRKRVIKRLEAMLQTQLSKTNPYEMQEMGTNGS